MYATEMYIFFLQRFVYVNKLYSDFRKRTERNEHHRAIAVAIFPRPVEFLELEEHLAYN